MDELIRTCGAMTSAGTPCKRAPIVGGFRCTLHGGASPEAKRMANEALLGARLPAARFLFDLIENYSRATCPACHMPTGDPNPVIRAAIAVLDRTGHGPSAHLTMTHEAPSEVEGLSDDQALDHLQEKLHRVQKMLDDRRRPDPHAIGHPEQRRSEQRHDHRPGQIGRRPRAPRLEHLRQECQSADDRGRKPDKLIYRTSIAKAGEPKVAPHRIVHHESRRRSDAD